MKIAVEGCMHGDLDNVYKTIAEFERAENTKIDLLICCGDFQAVRNQKDLQSLNVKPKYRHMNTFWKYYSGQEVAPIPTVFIGGNHEASNYLWELYYGGWAAPNIYFLGFAGVIKFGNIRIGGLSGIYNARHYKLGHFERPPYNESDIRSIYHVREYDVYRLLQIEEPIDIFLSHDWPIGITDCGNWRELVQKKPFFEKEIRDRALGSKPAAELLEKLKPLYWFSAHLHCKFAALVQHGDGGPVTKFLALDKCLPGRKFLQVIEIQSDPGPFEIEYDEEWLAITRIFNSAFPATSRPADLRSVQVEKDDSRRWVRNRLEASGTKPFAFARTAPCYDPSQPNANGHAPELYRNPQTEALLQLLELPYLLDDSSASREQSYYSSSLSRGSYSESNEDIPIDDVDELEELAAANDEELVTE
uniref:Lariat debranching enzyme C-terminal domain-containing protein n=1 Tax=Opuntia streptacantha TaxID=393608 RepID=A0A7C8Z2R8_OPUST